VYQVEKVFELVIEEGKTAKETVLLTLERASEHINTVSRSTITMKKDACLSALGNLELDVK
jgi:hypothetical protein